MMVFVVCTLCPESYPHPFPYGTTALAQGTSSGKIKVRPKKKGRKKKSETRQRKKKRFVRINATSQEDSKAQHRRGISHQTYLCTVYFAGPPFSVFSTFFFRNNRNTSGGRSMATVTLTCATAVRQEYERNVIQAVAAAAAAAVLVVCDWRHNVGESTRAVY